MGAAVSGTVESRDYIVWTSITLLPLGEHEDPPKFYNQFNKEFNEVKVTSKGPILKMSHLNYLLPRLFW